MTTGFLGELQPGRCGSTPTSRSQIVQCLFEVERRREKKASMLARTTKAGKMVTHNGQFYEFRNKSDIQGNPIVQKRDFGEVDVTFLGIKKGCG